MERMWFCLPSLPGPPSRTLFPRYPGPRPALLGGLPRVFPEGASQCRAGHWRCSGHRTRWSPRLQPPGLPSCCLRPEPGPSAAMGDPAEREQESGCPPATPTESPTAVLTGNCLLHGQTSDFRRTTYKAQHSHCPNREQWSGRPPVPGREGSSPRAPTEEGAGLTVLETNTRLSVKYFLKGFKHVTQM